MCVSLCLWLVEQQAGGVFCIKIHFVSSVCLFTLCISVCIWVGFFLRGGGGAITVYVCGQPIYTVFLCVCDSMLYVLCLVYVLLSVLFVVWGIISPLYGHFVTCVSSWYSVCPVCECFAVYVTLGSTLFDGSATSRHVLSGLILWREDFAMLISCILLLNCCATDSEPHRVDRLQLRGGGLPPQGAEGWGGWQQRSQ